MITSRQRARILCAGVLALVCTAGIARAQVKYLKGQSVVPVFEGWRRQADGSVLMYFGYLNRNYQQPLDQPIGPTNQFEPGPADRGQPTFFAVRRQRFVFTVMLPKDWDPKARLTWTVVANGQTEKAQGWLQPEWEIDDGVIAMNIGGGSSPPMPNAAPRFSGADESLTASVSTPLALKASATDDGVPKPRTPPAAAAAPRPAAATAEKPAAQPPAPPKGTSIRWMKYRGPGAVTFTTASTDGVYAKPTESATTATFSAPGSYVLRAIASDGYLESVRTFTVTVK